jgi:nicotinamidase-related amidase
MQFSVEETAVVLVEFQQQWTQKGLFHWLIKNQLASRNVVENTRQLVAEARQSGVTIIHAPLIVDPQHKKGWLAYPTMGRVFTKDSWQSEIVSGLFVDGDPVSPREVYNLKGFDAFFASPLEQILVDREIKNLFICGFATDQCPAKTLRTAVAKGFNPYLVSDCTATFNEFFQKSAERRHSDRVVTSPAVLAGLA